MVVRTRPEDVASCQPPHARLDSPGAGGRRGPSPPASTIFCTNKIAVGRFWSGYFAPPIENHSRLRHIQPSELPAVHGSPSGSHLTGKQIFLGNFFPSERRR